MTGDSAESGYGRRHVRATGERRQLRRIAAQLGYAHADLGHSITVRRRPHHHPLVSTSSRQEMKKSALSVVKHSGGFSLSTSFPPTRPLPATPNCPNPPTNRTPPSPTRPRRG